METLTTKRLMLKAPTTDDVPHPYALEDCVPWIANVTGQTAEAGLAVLRHAFRERPANEIKSSVFQDNEPSLKVQKKLGFEVTSIGTTYSVSRKVDVPSTKTALTRKAFENAGHMQSVTNPTLI